MPIGITDTGDPTNTKIQLKDGDTVVMVSDGISEGDSDLLRLTDLIGLNADMSVNDLARQIAVRAKSVNGDKDDMSVLVIRLSKAS